MHCNFLIKKKANNWDKMGKTLAIDSVSTCNNASHNRPKSWMDVMFFLRFTYKSKQSNQIHFGICKLTFLAIVKLIHHTTKLEMTLCGLRSKNLSRVSIPYFFFAAFPSSNSDFNIIMVCWRFALTCWVHRMTHLRDFTLKHPRSVYVSTFSFRTCCCILRDTKCTSHGRPSSPPRYALRKIHLSMECNFKSACVLSPPSCVVIRVHGWKTNARILYP